jgi:mono/diheme cytochrome c family protein
MKKALKWLALVLGGLVVLLGISIAAMYTIGNSRLTGIEITTRPITVPADEASIARGEHLVQNISGCASCHGLDLSGKVFVEDPMIGIITASNLTRGSGGVGSFYTVEDWDRAIRHGVSADGRILGGMPSNHYAHLSDEDLSAIIAYLQNVPAVDHVLPARAISFPGTVIFGVLDYANLPYANVNHEAVGTNVTEMSVSPGYGEYLVRIAVCADCHGADLAGRSPQDAQPGPPAGPDLTSSGSLGNWSAQEFMTAMRAGRTPDGRQLSEEMPWMYYAGMTDNELEAMYLYLRQLP